MSKGLLAFAGVAAVLVLVANTPGYPIALGLAVIALLYVLLDSSFPLLLNQLTGLVAGATGQKG